MVLLGGSTLGVAATRFEKGGYAKGRNCFMLGFFELVAVGCMMNACEGVLESECSRQVMMTQCMRATT